MLEAGYDVVFRVGEMTDSGLISQVLAPYPLVLCAARSYLDAHPPIRIPADLQDHECLMFLRGALAEHWAFQGPDGLVTVRVSGRLSSHSGESLLRAALAGLGLLLQPRALVADAIDRGARVNVLPGYPVPERPLHLLYAPDSRVTPKLRSLLDFSRNAFGRP